MWALYLSGAWNIIGGASALANPDAHFAQFYTTRLLLDDPLQAFFFRTTWINAIAWGMGYTMAGRFARARYRCSRPAGAARSHIVARAWVSSPRVSATPGCSRPASPTSSSLRCSPSFSCAAIAKSSKPDSRVVRRQPLTNRVSPPLYRRERERHPHRGHDRACRREPRCRSTGPHSGLLR